MTSPQQPATTTTRPDGITDGLIGRLRELAPGRPLDFTEALRVAKHQAAGLLRHLGIEDAPVPIELLNSYEDIDIIRHTLPISGFSHWTGERWIITVNSREQWRRQRATIAHEFKHILDHQLATSLYTGGNRHEPSEQAELAASYFAGCVLVPKRLLKAAWCSGMQNVTDLADHFDVSVSAISTRLTQTGIAELHDLTPHRPYRPRRQQP